MTWKPRLASWAQKSSCQPSICVPRPMTSNTAGSAGSPKVSKQISMSPTRQKLSAMPDESRRRSTPAGLADRGRDAVLRGLGGRDKRARHDQLLRLALGRDAHDVPHEADALHRADDPGGRVELATAEAVLRRAREGVVVVVPGLAEGRQREPEDVGRVVLDVEAPAPEEVADGVDRPRHVVDEEDAHEAAPQQAGERAGEAAGDEVAGQRRQREAEDDEPWEGAVDAPHAAILHQVGGVLALAREPLLADEPPEVRVDEAAQALAATDVRAVRIALLVGMRVVLAVIGDPRDHGPLDRHRAHRGEEILDRLARRERAMGEQAVEADGHPEAGDEVHDAEEDEVVGAHAVAPEQGDGPEEGDEGDDDGEQIRDSGGS